MDQTTPSPAQRIIDSDINHWTAFVETLESWLRRCPPAQEPEIHCELELSRDVLNSLIAVRNFLDQK